MLSVMSLLFAVLVGCSFIFLRKEFTQTKTCVVSNILNSIRYYTVPGFSFGTMSLETAIGYLVVIITLKQRKKNMSTITQCRTSNGSDTDSKVTRAILLTLGAYLLLYSPSVVMSGVMFFCKSSTNNNCFEYF